MNSKKFSISLVSGIFMFLYVQFAYAQCNAPGFTVTPTNGTCLSNASIDVQIPGASTCSGWTAYVAPSTGGEFSSPIPSDGGPVNFTGLPAGDYNVRISNGLTTYQYSGNPVTLTTTYVNMSITSTNTAPSCNASTPGYTPNGTLTITKNSGGVGPFVYEVTSSVGTQTFGPTTDTNHTFSGMPAGEQVSFTVTDQVNGNPGCATSVTQQPTMAATTSNLTYYRTELVRATPPNCTGYNIKAKILSSGSNQATLLLTGNATISISGGTSLNMSGVANGTSGVIFTLPSTIIPGGASYVMTFNNGCEILSISETAPVVDNTYLDNFITTALDPVTCAGVFNIRLNGRTLGVSNGMRSGSQAYMYNESNSLLFEQEQPAGSGNWVVVSPVNTLPANPLSINEVANTNYVDVQLPAAGNYRITASDGCHTVVKTIVMPAPANLLNNIGVSNSRNSILEGTGGFNFTVTNSQGPLLSYPVTVNITRVDGQTSVPINPNNPYNQAGPYTVNFPVTFSVNSYSTVNLMAIGDLPPGDYLIQFTDNCGQTSNHNLTPRSITTTAHWAPVVNPLYGCTNSNSVQFDMNETQVNGSTTARVWTSDGTNPSAVLPTTPGNINAYSGTFNNIPSGDYFLVFNGQTFNGGVVSTNYSAAKNQVGPWSFNSPFNIPAYQNPGLTYYTANCDSSANSGIIATNISSGTPVFPITYELYTSSDLVTPIQSFTQNDPLIWTNSFSGLAAGDYVYKMITPCYTQQSNITINSSTPPLEVLFDVSVVCLPNTAVRMALNTSTFLHNIEWRDASNNLIGTDSYVDIVASGGESYSVTYSINPAIGCTTSTPTTINFTIPNSPCYEICANNIDDDGDGNIDESCQPFYCDGKLYMTYQNASSEFIFNEFNPNTITLNPISNLTAQGLVGEINAIGYNPTDNFVYGINPISPYQLYRIDATGTIDQIGTISGMVNGSVAGCFDDNGNYYVTGTNQRLYRIDLSTQTATQIGGSTGFSFGDIAYNKYDGLLYTRSITNNTNYSINPITGVTTALGAANTAYHGVGASFIDFSGNYYAYMSNASLGTQFDFQTFAKIDFTTNTITNLGTGPTTGAMDGCSCDYGVGLGKVTSVAIVDQGGSLTFTFTIYNHTGASLSSMQFLDALPAGMTFTSNPLNVLGGISITGSSSGLSTADLMINNIPIGESSFQLTAAIACGSYTFNTLVSNQATLHKQAGAPTYLPSIIYSDNTESAPYQDATNFEVLLTNACCPPNPTVITPSSTDICAGNLVTYSVTPVANAYQYLWTLPSGAIITNGADTSSITVQYNTPTTGNVCVKAINILGCASDFYCIPVTVAALPNVPYIQH